MSPPGSRTLERVDFDALFDALARRGYTVVGPTVRDEAIVYDEIARQRRPAGRLDRRAGRRPLPPAPPRRRGAVRLRGRPALLEAATSSRRRSGSGARGATTTARSTELAETPREPPRYAFLGARSCELHAMGILDRVLLGGAHPDPADARAARATCSSSPSSAARRAGPASASRWAPGRRAESRLRPRADRGARGRPPLLRRRGRHRARGAEVLGDAAAPRAAGRRAATARRAAHERAAAQMGRELDTDRHQGAAVPQLRAPALGRGRRALPDLRQLHDGLPDLLLHDRRGRHRPRRASTSSATSAGTRASRSTTRTSTAARCAARRARATASG